MNNKLLIISNAIMGIAIAILFILHFTNDTGNDKKSNTDHSDQTAIQEYSPEKINQYDHSVSSDKLINNPSSIVSFDNLKIAFVNSDTVSEHYLFAKKLKKELLKKQAKAESQVKTKYAKYQKLVAEYQQAAEIMGQNEAAEKAQTIGLLEQEIMQLEQTLSQNLADQEIKASSDYIKITDEYMQKIGQDLGYDYVLSYRVGGPMLFANPDLDITQIIIKLLNKKYENRK